MKIMTRRALNRLLFTALFLVPASCIVPPSPAAPGREAVVSETAAQSAARVPTQNLIEGCVENYAEGIDYFPDKITVDYSQGLEVEYFDHYKVVTVLNPWRGAEVIFEYVLVQCGSPVPDGYDEAQIIEVPIQRITALSTTILPALDELDLVDRLVAVDEFDYVNTAAVRERIDAGTLAEVSDGGALNIEVALEQEPDLVMTFAYGNPEWDVHPKLQEAGLKTAIIADYMETSPLGQAEWLKFIALFFNAEAKAQNAFRQKAERYREIAALVSDVSERPSVFTGIYRGDSWWVSGGDSHLAHLIHDAGAQYLWSDDDSTGSIPLDFETVFDRAANAEFWLPNTASWYTMADVTASDERYAELAAYQNAAIFDITGRTNAFGGNDYFEAGVANPDRLLADLIAIFHPDLLPDHEPVFFQRVDE